MRVAVLERQLEEFTVLAAMYTGDDEFVTDDGAIMLARAIVDGELPPLEAIELTASVKLALNGGSSTDALVSTLQLKLPLAYPVVAAELSFSCPHLSSAALEAVQQVLAATSAKAAAEQREALVECCLASQHEAEQQIEAEQAAAVPTAPPPCSPANLGADVSSEHRVLIWFHHMKSVEKRKSIVAGARDARLRGFSKPGLPGVVAAEGEPCELTAFVSALRAMRWQAMDVRYEGAVPPAAASGKDGGSASGRLPSPFVELAESAMGEAATLCAAAGMLDEFKGSILKIEVHRDDPPPARPDDGSAAPDASRAAAPRSDSTVGEDAAEEVCEMVLAIDHMNDRSGYTRLLNRWASQLGLGARLWYAVGGGRQARGIVLVLHGTDVAARAFVQRLRTENVDVNRGGKPCRERQATVLQQGAHIGGGRCALCGWATSEYPDSAALQAELVAVGISEDLVEDLARSEGSRTRRR